MTIELPKVKSSSSKSSSSSSSPASATYKTGLGLPRDKNANRNKVRPDMADYREQEAIEVLTRSAGRSVSTSSVQPTANNNNLMLRLNDINKIEVISDGNNYVTLPASNQRIHPTCDVTLPRLLMSGSGQVLETTAVGNKVNSMKILNTRSIDSKLMRKYPGLHHQFQPQPKLPKKRRCKVVRVFLWCRSSLERLCTCCSRRHTRRC